MTPAAMTKRYADVHDLICKNVHSFIKRNGTQWGTFEELFAAANLLFMRAVKDYKRKDGNRSSDAKFSTWCHWVVSKGLLDIQRNSIQREKRCQITVRDMTDDVMPTQVSNFNMVDFLDELSEDAQYVVKLSVKTPAGLRHAMLSKKRDAARNTRAALRQYLIGYGWTHKRIDSAFEEIKDQLDV